MKHPIVYIEWSDACSAPDKWMGDDDLPDWIKSGGWLVKHVGFLLEENKDFIVIAAMEVDESEFSKGFHGHVHKIPKAWCKITHLKK